MPPSQNEIEVGMINAQLNSVIMYVLLMGMYTMVFAWSLHVYCSRKENRNRLITATLVALYVNTVADLGIQWQFIQNAFVYNGETRSTILSAINEGQPVIIIVGTAIQWVGYFLADGLLLWRCFQITNRSLLAISVPLFLYFSVIVFSIVSLVFTSLSIFNASKLPPIGRAAVNLFGGGSFVYILDAATSLSATFIIFRRISKSLTHMSGQSKYRRIIRIIIETAVLYSLTTILLTIVVFVNQFAINLQVALQAVEATNYLLAINAITTGLAPTIMVAQIGLASSATKTETDSSAAPYQFSALEFQHQQTSNASYVRHDTQHHVSTLKEHHIEDGEK